MDWDSSDKAIEAELVGELSKISQKVQTRVSAVTGNEDATTMKKVSIAPSTNKVTQEECLINYMRFKKGFKFFSQKLFLTYKNVFRIRFPRILVIMKILLKLLKICFWGAERLR